MTRDGDFAAARLLKLAPHLRIRYLNEVESYFISTFIEKLSCLRMTRWQSFFTSACVVSITWR